LAFFVAVLALAGALDFVGLVAVFVIVFNGMN